MNVFKNSAFCILASVTSANAQDFAKNINEAQQSSIASFFGSLGAGRVDIDTDILSSDDVDIVKSTVAIEQALGAWTLTGSYGRTNHQVIYTTPPGQGSRVTRDEDTNEYSLGIEKQLNPNLSVSLTGQYTKGFSDHRSIWIAERNLQAFGGNALFRQPNPQSYSISLGANWDYLPGKANLQATLGFSSALIVPGYGVDPDAPFDPTAPTPVLVSEEEIDTFSGSLIWGTVINKRIRTQQTARISVVENREVRTQLSSDWAFALTDSLVLRAQIGGSIEQPTFDDYYGGLTLVYDLNSHWQFQLGARYYDDTGEISSSGFDTSATPVTNQELSLGLLWQKQNLSVRVSAALYDVDYESVPVGPRNIFSNLYSDRNFVASRVAITYQF